MFGQGVPVHAFPVYETPRPQVKFAENFAGAYTRRVKLEVPGFRGLEPKLALAYNSGGGLWAAGLDGGLLGVGWSLTGLPEIMRIGDRRGIATFGAGDRYLLDDNEIYPCSSVASGRTSPGCAAGGTHVGEYETYLKIVHDDTNNLWTIWRRDGTQMVFRSVSHWFSGTYADTDEETLATKYRFRLASVTDTRGNAVTYDYACTTLPACYPSQVSYNNTVISFLTEASPSPLTRANGIGMTVLTQRLKTIDIKVSGSRLRTYALGYDQSPATGLSRLVSVQQYGTDALLDAAGAVTSGTALPAYGFSYSGAATAKQAGPGGPMLDARNPGDVGVSYGNFSEFGLQTVRVYSTTATGSASSGTEDVCYYKRSDQSSAVRINDCPIGSIGVFLKRTTLSLSKSFTLTYRRLSNCSDSGGIFSGTPRCSVGSVNATIGDFDGDNLDDLWFPQGSHFSFPNDNKVVLSTGQSWSTAGSLSGVADYNGDGRDDMRKGTGTITLYLSNGVNAFSSQTTTGTGANFIHSTGDYNGDGLQDFLLSKTGSDTVTVYYTSGTDLIEGPSFDAKGASGCKGCAQSVDLDGDGRADLVSTRLVPGTLSVPSKNFSNVYLNRGDHFEHLLPSGATDTHGDPVAVSMDIDGDGLVEAVTKNNRTEVDCVLCGSNSNPSPINVLNGGSFKVQGSVPDLLTEVVEPLGGKVTVGYTPSSAWSNTYLPYVVQTVSSVTRDDGRGTVGTATYSYQGGQYVPSNRRFHGFRKVVTTLPRLANETAAPTIETLFRQDIAAYGKIEQVDRRDGAGTLLQRREESYATQTSLPRTALNTKTRSTEYYGGTGRTKVVEKAYDAYGLLVSTTDLGDEAVTGDERIYTRVSYPNTSAYIVDRWAVETVNSGSVYDDTVNRIWRRWHEYDGQGVTVPPTVGNETKLSQWTGAGPDDKADLKTVTYDSYGNPTSVTDAVGGVTRYLYDATYNLYVTETRNALYDAGDTRQKTLTSWDGVCGLPLSETDANGSVTSHSYDALCRLTRSDFPDGGYESIAYESWGSPSGNILRKETPGSSGHGAIASRTYHDGFGREHLSLTQTAAIGGDSRVQLTFDARGNLSSRSHPHYAGDTVKNTLFEYDALNRETKKTNPDATVVSTTYGAGDAFRMVETTNEIGEVARVHLDAYGNEVFRDRVIGGATRRTAIRYDARDRIVSVTDPKGAQFAYQYDGLDNRTVVDDPDHGLWEMAYDVASRLLERTDAKGVKTVYTYDALGRVVSRTRPGGGSSGGGSSGGGSSATITGTSDDDVLNGTAGDDVIDGLAGNDEINGLGGNDILTGGPGADSLQGGGDNDTIYADAEDTWFSGDAGIDTLVYEGTDDRQYAMDQGAFENARIGAGNNTVWGTVGANTIEGEAGDDVLFGYGGDDVLKGGPGADSLQGGGDNDTIYADADDTWFSGDAGIDTLVYEGTDDRQYAMDQGAFENARIGAGNNTVWGTAGANTIEGEAGDDVLFGYGGDDVLKGGPGADSLQGGGDNDTIYADAEDTWFSGDAGIDTLVYEGTDDRQYAMDQGAFENVRIGVGNNTVWGTADANTIEGEAGNDELFGYGGNDVLIGGPGSDTLQGGAGSDTFRFLSGQSGTDTISDFAAGAGSEDVLVFDSSIFADFAAVVAAASDNGTDTTITLGFGTSIVLQNVLVTDLHSNDVQFN